MDLQTITKVHDEDVITLVETARHEYHNEHPSTAATTLAFRLNELHDLLIAQGHSEAEAGIIRTEIAAAIERHS